jgi:hypothetical protein
MILVPEFWRGGRGLETSQPERQGANGLSRRGVCWSGPLVAKDMEPQGEAEEFRVAARGRASTSGHDTIHPESTDTTGGDRMHALEL